MHFVHHQHRIHQKNKWQYYLSIKQHNKPIKLDFKLLLICYKKCSIQAHVTPTSVSRCGHIPDRIKHGPSVHTTSLTFSTRLSVGLHWTSFGNKVSLSLKEHLIHNYTNVPPKNTLLLCVKLYFKYTGHGITYKTATCK